MTIEQLLTKLKVLEAAAGQHIGTPVFVECKFDTDGWIDVCVKIRHPGEDEYIGVGFVVSTPAELETELAKVLAEMGAA